MARIYVGMPVMGGFFAPMVKSLLDLLQENPDGHEFKFDVIFNESLISRARNNIGCRFLESDYDYLLTIDADLSFPPDAVARLVRHDKDIVAAPYVTKSVPPAWALRFFSDRIPLYVEGLLEAQYVSTGFLLVKRRVFERMRDTIRWYGADGATRYEFYSPFIHELDGKPYYLGEDWAFCQRANDLGFQIFADFDIKLFHYGMTAYYMPHTDGRLPVHPMLPIVAQADAISTSLKESMDTMQQVPAGPNQQLQEKLQEVFAQFQEVQSLVAGISKRVIEVSSPE